jgi:hypothetical protein
MKFFLALAILVMGLVDTSYAQVATGNEFQTTTSGKLVTGVVNMCVNGSNIAVPCGSSSSPVLTSTSGSANIATGQVTVGTTATQIVPARSGRISVKTTDLGTTDLFCGAAGVTTATGDLLAGVKGGSITVPTGAAFYCVVATGTQAVSFMESY